MNKLSLIKRLKLHAVLLLFLAFLYLALKFAVPYFVVSAIKNSLNDNVKDKVGLENVSFEPLNLTLKIKNLNLDQNTSLKSLSVDFSFPNLVKKRIFIAQIQIDGLKGNLVKNGNIFLADAIKYQNKEAPKSQNNWDVKISKAEIANSTISAKQEHKIELKKVEISNISPIKSGNFTSLDFKAVGLIDGSNIALDGKMAAKDILINFNVNNFDLNLLNLFLDKKNTDFGKITGQLSSKGVLEMTQNTVKLDSNLELRNIFLYSGDLKVIKYFIEGANVQKLSVVNNKSALNVKSSILEISHLLLSANKQQINKDKTAKFSNIKIKNINVESLHESRHAKALVNFKDGGFFALNKYGSSNKKIFDVQAKGVDLTQFSTIIEPLLNYQIESGKLSLDTKISLVNNNIGGKVTLNLAQLNLDDKNEFGENIQNQSLMPLKTAISMIKDDNGNIDLYFNLSGDKDDPDFDILEILGKGAGSIVMDKIVSLIVTKAAIKFAPLLISSIPLSPSNAIMITQGAYKMVTKPRFKDIKFDLLNNNIAQDSKGDLETLIGFLQENKKIKLRICPVTSTLEFSNEEASNDKVIALANARIKSLKEFFNKSHGSKVLNQIIFCRPQISSDKNISKAEISI